MSYHFRRRSSSGPANDFLGVNENDISENLPRRRSLSSPASDLLYRPSLEKVQIEGEIIYRSFLEEELKEDETVEEILFNADITDNQNKEEVRQLSQELEDLRHEVILPARARTPEGYRTADIARAGREIREWADDFARSAEGSRVRERADSVPLSNITEDRFINLLYGVFLEEFSRERLIALFVYCSRLLVRALQARAFTLSMNLFRWSLEYIRNQVSQWVYKQGGWEKVLGTISWEEILLICGVVVIPFLVYYLYNR